MPIYLGVKLDKALTYRHQLLHTVIIAQKTIHARFAAEATCRFRMGRWCQDIAHSCFSLIYLIAKNCASAWCRSAHTRLIDSVLNDALSIATGCLRPTPTDNLPVFSSIQPAKLRSQGATLSLANRCALDPGHILHDQLT